MSQQNEALVRRVFDEIFSGGNLDVADEVFAEDVEIDNGMESSIRGPESTKQTARMMRQAFPDFRADVQDLMSVGDRVIARWVGRGTHRGEFLGIAPTGKPIELRVIDISEISNGKIKRVWANPDIFGVLSQIGAVQA